MEDADPFLDDDLDDIPDTTLLQLEQNAISSTQKPPIAALPIPPSQHLRKQAHNASSLNRSQGGNKNLPWRAPQRQLSSQYQQAPPVSAPDPPTSHYDFGDENVIDLDEPSRIIEPNVARRPLPHTSSRNGQKAPLDAETAAAFAAADAELSVSEPERWKQAPHLQPSEHDTSDLYALQARIAELEAEQARLRQAEQQARGAVEAKKGEIAIVRANHDRERKEYDRKFAAMQKSHAEDVTKHKADLEAGRKERDKMQTDNRFLQHDLAQEAERVKRLNGPGKVRTGPSEKTTPRKVKRTGLGDGFDDDEVQIVSPSKSRERPKDSTPKAGSKRKRIEQDSPAPALSFTKPPSKLREDSTDQAPQTPEISNNPNFGHDVDENYLFMQRLLNHRPSEGEPCSIELFARFALPSARDRSIASILLADLTSTLSIPEEQYMPMRLARSLLRCWRSCLDETYYEPISLLLDTLRFALLFELPSTTSRLVEEAVPLCLKSLELVTLPVVRAHLRGQDGQVSEELARQISADEISNFLHLLCRAATISPDCIEAFWRAIDFTNAMLLLHTALSVERVTVGMQILATSALPESFGTIHANHAEQEQQEKNFVYRLTFALSDVPTAPKDEPAYTQIETSELRIEVLNVFKAMCTSEHCTRLLALHPHFIGRLVRFLDEQICILYTLPPSKSVFAREGRSDDVRQEDDIRPDAHDLVVTSINLSMHIVYHLLRTCEDSIDLSEKFAVVTGGYHRFIISLTRIAFIEEPSVYETGLEEEVIDAAHAILDAFLTPEDGEAIAQSLETPRTIRSATSKRSEISSFDSEAMDVDGALDRPV